MKCISSPQSMDERFIKAQPELITKDPSCVKGCDIVLLMVPSSCHEQYFTALEPHVTEGTVFAVMPARSGCDFLFRKVMGAKAERLGLAAFETLPWSCRVDDWGKSCAVLGTKENISAAVLPPVGRTSAEVIAQLQDLFGRPPRISECPNMMSISLGNPGQVLHPAVMYSRWKDWDGQALRKKPPFYQGVDSACVEMLKGISADIQSICRELKGVAAGCDTSQVRTFEDWYFDTYAGSCTNTASLQSAILTNSAYGDLCHPMKGDEQVGYKPDFQFRYLSEDIPTGLCFTKGVADLLEVKTPTIDKVLRWCQEKLGKDYLTRDGRMAGKDIRYTRAPQAYDVLTKKDLLLSLQLEPVMLPWVAFLRPLAGAVVAVLLAASCVAAFAQRARRKA